MDEFTDAFSLILEDQIDEFFILLENNHSASGKIDLYEALAAIVIISNDDFDKRL